MKNGNYSNEVAITNEMDSMKLIQKGEDYIGVALGSEREVVHSNNEGYKLSDGGFQK